MLHQRDRRSYAPPNPTPDALLRAARARHHRRALEQAAEHGAALLASLGLPRIVGPDFVPINPAEVGAAVEAAIAALDELDAPGEDLEDEDDDLEPCGDDENTLGWTNAVRQIDLGQGSEDGEHTLGAPERSPWIVSLSSPHYEPARGLRQGRCFLGGAWAQTAWAQGARQDGEGEAEPGYDLPEGDDERCGSEHDGCEPSLGWPEDIAAKVDPKRQWLADADREFDPVDDVKVLWGGGCPASDARAAAQRIAAGLVHRAKALRRGAASPPEASGNLVLVDLRVIGVRPPAYMGGGRWIGGPVHG